MLAMDEWGSALGYANLTIADDDENVKERVDELEKRVDHLQSIARIKKHLNSAKVFSTAFKWVPSDYYDRSLEARAVILESPVDRLCKTMAMENTAWQEGQGEGFNPRYVLVLVQYKAKFNSEKLASVIHKMAPKNLSKKAFHFRLAPEEVAIELTGFKHNAVCPFGVLQPKSLPIIAAKAVFGSDDLSIPSYIWMGGGHPDLKLGCSSRHFVKALQPVIADISDPR